MKINSRVFALLFIGLFFMGLIYGRVSNAGQIRLYCTLKTHVKEMQGVYSTIRPALRDGYGKCCAPRHAKFEILSGGFLMKEVKCESSGAENP